MARTHFHDDHTLVVPGRAYSYAPRAGGGLMKSTLSFANCGATSLFTTGLPPPPSRRLPRPLGALMQSIAKRPTARLLLRARPH